MFSKAKVNKIIKLLEECYPIPYTFLRKQRKIDRTAIDSRKRDSEKIFLSSLRK